MNTDQILAEREKTHGDYANTSRISQRIKRAIHEEWDRAGKGIDDPEMLESLDMIANKIARIVAGDVTFVDHWFDICGYAQLIVNALAPKPEGA